jgi:hypothetical protein
LLALVLGPQPRLLERHLLSVHHAVTILFAPAMRAAPCVLLMALAGQVMHFLVHHQVHQLQPGLPQQVSYSLLQQTDDVGHRKDHLHVGILFGGEPAELLHGSLLLDLISFLHSDSLLFLGRKINRWPIMAASLRVATFYGLSDNLIAKTEE